MMAIDRATRPISDSGHAEIRITHRRENPQDAFVESHPCAQNAQRWGTRQKLVGHTKLLGLTARPLLVIGSLTLLPGHGIKRGRFLLDLLAAALGTLRVGFVFLEGEN
jgi:hypothetical protein